MPATNDEPPVRYDPAMRLRTYRHVIQWRFWLALAVQTVVVIGSSFGLRLVLGHALPFLPYLGIYLLVVVAFTYGWNRLVLQRWAQRRQELPWFPVRFAGQDGLVWALTVNLLDDGRQTYREECLGEAYFADCPVCKQHVEFTGAAFEAVGMVPPDYGGLARVHAHPEFTEWRLA